MKRYFDADKEAAFADAFSTWHLSKATFRSAGVQLSNLVWMTIGENGFSVASALTYAGFVDLLFEEQAV